MKATLLLDNLPQAPKTPSLATIQAEIVAAQDWAKAESHRIGQQRRELEQTAKKLADTRNYVTAQRRVLARYEAAREEHQERKKAALAKGRPCKPFYWPDIEPLTESEIEDLAAQVPALEARVEELKQVLLPTGAETEAAFHAKVAHLETPLREMLSQAKQKVADLTAEQVNTLVGLRTEDDADRLIALRAASDQLPLRLACARIGAIDTELALIDVVGPNNYSLLGRTLVFKLLGERAEWQQQKESLALGTTVRNVSHLRRAS